MGKFKIKMTPLTIASISVFALMLLVFLTLEIFYGSNTRETISGLEYRGDFPKQPDLTQALHQKEESEGGHHGGESQREGKTDDKSIVIPSSFESYQSSFVESDQRDRIAIVVSGLGIHMEKTKTSVEILPSQVTLSFLPYTQNLQAWIETARDYGHEVLVDLPLEPKNFPQSDPGSYVLLSGDYMDENLEKLNLLLDPLTGIIGIKTLMGERLLDAPKSIHPVMSAVQKKGLLFLDHRADPLKNLSLSAKTYNMAYMQVTVDMRDEFDRLSIEQKLSRLEAKVNQKGWGILHMQPTALSIALVKNWIKTFPEKNYVLAPLSAVYRKQAGH